MSNIPANLIWKSSAENVLININFLGYTKN